MGQERRVLRRSAHVRPARAAAARTRHYERWVLYGREQYLKRISFPRHVYTKKQIADIFTKALDKTSFLKFRDALLNNPNSNSSFDLVMSLFQ